MTSIAQLFYGILFDGDYEFPWDQEKFNFSFEVWNSMNEKINIKSKMNINGSTILVLPNKILESFDFEHRQISKEELKINEDDEKYLYDFCKKHNLKITNIPNWYLTIEEKE
jgi:hypothetical protein